MDRVVTIHEKLLSERKHRGKMETTRACQMVIDYLFKNRAPYLLIDEIDEMSPRDQTFLLNLMETGIVTETKYGKTREAKIKTSVFATCNDGRKLSAPLQSRFFIVELEPYTYEQFYEITLHLLDEEFARIIADAVWNRSRNLRDCVRIGKLARSEEDVNFLIEKFVHH
jgi:MoxR-like ATPase